MNMAGLIARGKERLENQIEEVRQQLSTNPKLRERVEDRKRILAESWKRLRSSPKDLLLHVRMGRAMFDEYDDEVEWQVAAFTLASTGDDEQILGAAFALCLGVP